MQKQSLYPYVSPEESDFSDVEDEPEPTDAEINRYLPFIIKHIEIISPKILVLLGSTAMNALIGSDVVISKMRGKWIEKKIGK